MKYQIVHTFQKYSSEPANQARAYNWSAATRICAARDQGRKTGKPRCTPVGDGRIGNRFWLVAEHGMKAGNVRNIEHNPHVRLKLREGLRFHWYTGTAHLSQTMIRVSVSAGWRAKCQATPVIHGRCGSSVRNSSVFKLIWRTDAKTIQCEADRRRIAQAQRSRCRSTRERSGAKLRCPSK
jgi:hypothetical protein